jgi:CSLREA domain-containing protein
MRRHATWIAAALSAALLTCAAPSRAATFDVTKPTDGADGACDGDCSLREAVIAANNSRGADAITLHAQTYVLSFPNPIDPADPGADAPELGDVDVADDVAIEGAGMAQSIVDAGGIDRVFDVAAGASVRMTGLEVRNGRLGATVSGAGIRNAGALELTRVAVAHNQTRANAGGILNVGALTMTDSVVLDNVGVASGGIANRGTATLTGVTLAGNAGAEAPAAFDNRGTATLTNSTVSATHTRGSSVGSSSGQLALRGVTIGANDAGAGTLLGAFFDSEVTLVNTIVDGPCDGPVTSLGHNLEHGHTCGLGSAGDTVDSDPLLEPLGDNGGATSTHALAPGSPAIDAGDDAACPAIDQRGVTRPQGPHCDAGAFERVGSPPPSGNTPAGSNVRVIAGPVTITFAHVTAAGDTTATPSASGPPAPAGFAIDGSYYELATTAQFDTAEVCFAYAAPPPPAIAHFEGGGWRILTTTRDTGTAVCAQVSSFSPFALVRAKSVAEQLSDLIEQVVAASRLSPAAKALLLTRLRATLAAFDPNNPAQRRAACFALAAFTLLVRAQAGHPIPAAQAADWIAAAARISALLGCG